MKYAMGYKFGIDEDLVYDFLLSVGDAINGTKQEVIKRKVTAKIHFNKFLVIKIKVKLSCGTTLKFKHVEPITVGARLVQLGDNTENSEEDAVEALKAQLEQMGVTSKEENSSVGKIGFTID